ncbi:hypothetical protein [Sporomusa termitida]|uniref:Uncharacterized protein n=1 Tax=Sporomusa termitida TaxID=2377 RepID=A0A517DV66_9FIRM|nr:hypothetical protein [Sporomusa termitida]QDR81262.1 hypothetical protein SPTER_26370 [Sporomusa termitida]
MHELDLDRALNRTEGHLMRSNAQLAKMLGKAASVQAAMRAEYLGRVRSLEKLRNAFAQKHKELQIANESVF